MPANTIKVDRSTRWGNPFKIGEAATHPLTGRTVNVVDAAVAVELFELHIESSAGTSLAIAAQSQLRGKHLACWCREGDCCHGDVLLRVANSPPECKCVA